MSNTPVAIRRGRREFVSEGVASGRNNLKYFPLRLDRASPPFREQIRPRMT